MINLYIKSAFEMLKGVKLQSKYKIFSGIFLNSL